MYLHHFVRVDPLLRTSQHQDLYVGVTERVPLGAGVDNLGVERERLTTGRLSSLQGELLCVYFKKLLHNPASRPCYLLLRQGSQLLDYFLKNLTL